MKKLYVLAIAAFAVIAVSLGANPAFAVHAGSGQLVCGQCHTMHNSQGGTTFVAANQLKLLRATAANVHELCLSCHAELGTAGNQAYTSDVPGQLAGVYPPKVWKNTLPWDAVTYGFDTRIGAGGDFNYIGTVTAAGVVTLNTADGLAAANPSLGYGHSLSETFVVPPGGTAGNIDALTCTNCHDPHGQLTQPTDATLTSTNVYRMLKVKPVGAGGGTSTQATGVIFNNGGTSSIVSYTGAASHAATGGLATNLQGETPNAVTHVWPVFYGGSSNVYGAGLLNPDAGMVLGTGDAGISGWCAQCHDNWHEDIDIGNKGTDWTRHPINCDLNAGDNAADGCLGIAGGSGVTIIDFTHYTNNTSLMRRVPMAKTADPALGTFTAGKYYGTVNTDRVFCLSCHFAHAGPYVDALRWDYTTAVSAGSQNGASVASQTGCQQCHNRGGAYGI